jgi:CII-binding regulator of phage lambda lysogenization HflD
MAQENDIDLAIAALQAVKLVHQAYSSGAESAERVEDIAKMLAMNPSPTTQFGGIKHCVADAISKAFLNQPLNGMADPNHR